MGDIFKSRKTPKHLIIQEESFIPKKRRLNITRVVLLVVLLLVVTGVLMQFR